MTGESPFQRTRTWKESTDPDRDAKLDRIEQVTAHFPERCFAFDQFGPLSIRPAATAAPGHRRTDPPGCQRPTAARTVSATSTAATPSPMTSYGASSGPARAATTPWQRSSRSVRRAPAALHHRRGLPHPPDPPKTCPERPDQRVRARCVKPEKAQVTGHKPIFERSTARLRAAGRCGTSRGTSARISHRLRHPGRRRQPRPQSPRPAARPRPTTAARGTTASPAYGGRCASPASRAWSACLYYRVCMGRAGAAAGSPFPAVARDPCVACRPRPGWLTLSGRGGVSRWPSR
jgi:hypothetical protein